MKKSRFLKGCCLLLVPVLSGCAMFGNVLHTPRLKVESIRTVWTTPDYWKLSLNIKILNNNPLSLSLSRVSYTLATPQKKIVSRVYTALPAIPEYGSATVDIPVNLSLERIRSLFPGTQQLSITFKGDFYSDSPWQKSALSFSKNQAIIIPRIPRLEYKYIRTVNKKPVLFLQTTNQNQASLTLIKAKGYLQANGEKITLSLPRPVVLKPDVKTLIPLIPSRKLSKKILDKKNVYLTGEVNAVSSIGTMVIPITQTLPAQSK